MDTNLKVVATLTAVKNYISCTKGRQNHVRLMRQVNEIRAFKIESKLSLILKAIGHPLLNDHNYFFFAVCSTSNYIRYLDLLNSSFLKLHLKF